MAWKSLALGAIFTEAAGCFQGAFRDVSLSNVLRRPRLARQTVDWAAKRQLSWHRQAAII
jgi:hypothetical protein